MSSIKQKFGKRLRELRKSRGYTQEQLAELVSIEPQNLSKIECGMHFPQPEKIEKMAYALNVNIVDLFDFEHFQENTVIKKLIEKTINEFDSPKTELAFKIISALSLYKS